MQNWVSRKQEQDGNGKWEQEWPVENAWSKFMLICWLQNFTRWCFLIALLDPSTVSVNNLNSLIEQSSCLNALIVQSRRSLNGIAGCWFSECTLYMVQPDGRQASISTILFMQVLYLVLAIADPWHCCCSACLCSREEKFCSSSKGHTECAATKNYAIKLNHWYLELITD